jgi:hypothetical protein
MYMTLGCLLAWGLLSSQCAGMSLWSCVLYCPGHFFIPRSVGQGQELDDLAWSCEDMIGFPQMGEWWGE